VTLPAIDLVVEFAEGETLRTEISTKFRRDGAEQELAAAGLRLDAWWTDEAGDFALCLSRKDGSFGEMQSVCVKGGSPWPS
jgi:L-histidine Nalpha-methyltransferase